MVAPQKGSRGTSCKSLVTLSAGACKGFLAALECRTQLVGDTHTLLSLAPAWCHLGEGAGSTTLCSPPSSLTALWSYRTLPIHPPPSVKVYRERTRQSHKDLRMETGLKCFAVWHYPVTSDKNHSGLVLSEMRGNRGGYLYCTPQFFQETSDKELLGKGQS